MTTIVNISRRTFLKTGVMVGGGLLLGLGLPSEKIIAAPPAGPVKPVVFGPFLRISPDNTITIIVNKSEMGQGVYTSLSMLVAEELECEWRSIRVEAAPVDPAYNHTAFGIQITGGSTSVQTEWERMSKVGAAAREMLIAAAAGLWGVGKTQCRADKGMVIHKNGKKLTYGQLAEKAAEMKVPDKITLKKPSAYKIIGTPVARLDTPAKVNGSALFGCDVNIPGALTALIARPPVFGGKVKSFNAAKAKAIPGVKDIIEVETGIAVIADTFPSAEKGREALEIAWDEGALATLTTAGIRQEYSRLAGSPGAIARKEGDPEKILKGTYKQIEAEYEVPYLAHATMEPLNCVVDLRADRCEIWTGTQSQTSDRNAAAGVSGLRPEQIRLHTMFLGGGFGRRGNPHSDFVTEAVQVAKRVKKPLKVIWTREDDMMGGYYRPFWYDRMSAGLDPGGNLMAWHHTIVGQSIMAGTFFEEGQIKKGVDPTSVEGAAEIPYEIPNLLVQLHSPKTGVPVQWWRSVGHSHTGFVVESFIDEIAHSAVKDPYEFRRNLLANHPRHRGVLEMAAQKAGWGKPLAKGRARGIAMHESFGSFVAQVAEVSVSPGGEVRVHKVVCAVDCGRFVNPGIIEAQMESGIVFGLSAALYGAITFKNGRVEQDNFDTYPLLRIGEMPVVEVHIVKNAEAPGGIGEPGTPPIAPAVTNAIFAATGKRIRRLPIDTGALSGT